MHNQVVKPAAIIFVFLAASARAQVNSADPLAALQVVAEKRSADWDTLARGLEVKLARMLPCDPRARTSIEEVSRASDARLTALGQYLQASAAQAKADVARIQRLLAEQESAAKDVEIEKAEADQERAAIEGRASDLAESSKRRPSLAEAQKKLAEIAAMTRERTARAQEEVARRQALASALRQIGEAYQVRQKAIEMELSALVIETSRWGEYYAARMARAQTECSVTNPTGPPQRKKQ
jgi:hypothetical protein